MREERPAARRTAQIFTDTPLPPYWQRSFFQAGITPQHIASALQTATTATLGNMTCKHMTCKHLYDGNQPLFISMSKWNFNPQC
jgi:hypothetical protein